MIHETSRSRASLPAPKRLAWVDRIAIACFASPAPSAARALASSATSSANVSLAGASVTSADRGRLIGRRVGSVRADDSGALGKAGHDPAPAARRSAKPGAVSALRARPNFSCAQA